VLVLHGLSEYLVGIAKERIVKRISRLSGKPFKNCFTYGVLAADFFFQHLKRGILLNGYPYNHKT
jgi:hypothetical protein